MAAEHRLLLGHAKLDTTTIYTRVSIRMLKDIHTATHPARLERTVSLATPAVSEAQDCGPEAARDALLAALAEEARDEEGGLPS